MIWQCGRELEQFVAEHDAWNDDFAAADRAAIRAKFPESTYIIVKHESRQKWYKKFLEDGVDTAITPPEMRYGRLTVYPEGKMLQTPIEKAGLYVSPPPFRYDQGVLIAVKPSELAVSDEAASTCHTPECGLYYRKDGLIRDAQIPAHRVLGLYDWIPKAEKYWRYGGRHSSSDWHWQFTPNSKAVENPVMKRIIDCLSENPPDASNLLEWRGCK